MLCSYDRPVDSSRFSERSCVRSAPPQDQLSRILLQPHAVCCCIAIQGLQSATLLTTRPSLPSCKGSSGGLWLHIAALPEPVLLL